MPTRMNFMAMIGLFFIMMSQFTQAEVFRVSNSLKGSRTQRVYSELNKEKRQWSYLIDIRSFEGELQKKLPLRNNYYELKVEGMNLVKKAGHPELPYKSFLVKGRPEDIKASFTYEKEAVFEKVRVKPAPLKACRCLKDLSQGLESFPIKATAYQQSIDDVVTIESVGDYRGVAYSKVILRPMIQKGDELVVFSGLNLQISSTKSLEVEDFVAQTDSMVLVTPRKLLAGAQDFKTYKEEDGLQVSLYIYEDIAQSAGELKTFFHNLYRQNPYQYAVLFGHEGILPPLKVPTSSDPNTPSDYPYFTMGGPQDIFPDVFYSRIVANDNEEVKRQVQKMREYRDRSWSDASGEKRAIGIASNEGWNPTDVEYIGQMIDPLVQNLGFQRANFFQDQSNSNAREINRALNSGARWLNYIGHGSGISWSSITTDEYSSSDIKKLRPGAVKPVIIDVACQNGRFSYEGKLGERFMNEDYRGQPIGAVAYYGGSVDISWDPPALMAVAIGKELATQRTRGLFELIMVGQRHLVETYDDKEAAHENLRWYHLFGDPSMVVNQF